MHLLYNKDTFYNKYSPHKFLFKYMCKVRNPVYVYGENIALKITVKLYFSLQCFLSN